MSKIQHPSLFKYILDIAEDMYVADEVRWLFRGKGLHEADKRVIGEVIKYYLISGQQAENMQYADNIRNYMYQCLTIDGRASAQRVMTGGEVLSDTLAIGDDGGLSARNSTQGDFSLDANEEEIKQQNPHVEGGITIDPLTTVAASAVVITSALAGIYDAASHMLTSHAKSIIEGLDGAKIYEIMMKELECRTPEKLLAYMLLGLKPANDDLLIKLTHVFGRVPKLEHKQDWLNNYSINAYLDVFTLVTYKKFDPNNSPDVWAIEKYSPDPIREDVSLPFKRLREKYVGRLREFMIEHNCIPGIDLRQYFTEFKFDGSHISDKDLCDICYQVFVGGTYYCHGCDAFFLNMTLSIEEMIQAMKRYPSLLFYGVLNSQTYESRSGGEHWVFLGLRKMKASLICSQGSDFGVFRDGGRLRMTLEKYGFGLSYNSRVIQHDNNNCSFYSVLSVWGMMMFDNIQKVVDFINDNGTGMIAGKDISDVRERLINGKSF